jgi:hypothetical protein
MGHFCPMNSTSSMEHKCGEDGRMHSVYCPEGSGKYTTADPGEFTVGPANTSGAVQDSSVPCYATHYCVQGIMIQCPAGRFGCADRLRTAECNGNCSAGYFCEAGSESNLADPCGGPHVYCPSGSGAPVWVDAGFYSTGGSADNLHTTQAACEAGSYCVNGTKVCGVGTATW